MRYSFCTYFDRNYILLGLALYRSLKRHCPDFCLYVLCLDAVTYDLLTRMADRSLVPIRLADLEAWDQNLLKAKANRSHIEYYFTITPSVCLYVLETFNTDVITYLDADVYFFSSPAVIYEALGDQSILATEHGFPDRLKKYEEYGRFNVQYESFRADDQGLSCLRRWRDQCLDSCPYQLVDGKYADQKYLDEWPSLYDRLVVPKHPGVGVASWNIEDKHVHLRDGKVYVGDMPLVFYHFHGFKYLGGRFCKTGLGSVAVRLSRRERGCIFDPYVSELRRIKAFLARDMGYRMPWLDQKGGVIRHMLSAFKYRDLHMVSHA